MSKSKKIKKTLLFLLTIISMISFIVFIMRNSEPKYIDGISTNISQYSIVSVDNYGYSNGVSGTDICIVLQASDKIALVKDLDAFGRTYAVDLDSDKIRLVGEGTFYHKVNSFIGFNIMLITELFIAVLCFIVCVTATQTFNDLLTDL